MISDLVLSRELPDAVAGSVAAYAGCIAGAVRKEEYLRLLEAAGFREVRVVEEARFQVGESGMEEFAETIAKNFDIPLQAVRDAARAVLSVRVFGRKRA